MATQKKVLLWFGLVLTVPATFYAAGSAVFYAWMNAAEPVRWTMERAALYFYSDLVLLALFLGIFMFCLVSLIKDINKKTKAEQQPCDQAGRCRPE